ncbi:hypothetical protein J4427_02420 [Candidatus Woesearchaeota archaeon]|nr:hypothetical protein [Candidatus Woesearchaeota archaeon]
MDRKIKLKIARNIVIAFLIVIGINFLVLYSLNFPAMAVSQIKKYFLLLVLLITGFGVQIGLFTYLKHKSVVCSATSMASGGISSISMILCCSHYALNIFPFMSASLASSLAKYTLQILLFGLLANAVGIYFMVKKMRHIKK